MINLQGIFSPAEIRPDQDPAIEMVRSCALRFAEVVVAQTPVCPDQTMAVRKIREAMHTAHDAIRALDPPATEPERPGRGPADSQG